MDMIKYKFATIIILISLLSFSCENDLLNNNSNEKQEQHFPVYGGHSSYTDDKILQQYNNGNLTGVIELHSLQRNDYTINYYNGQWTPVAYDGVNTEGYAGLIDNNLNPLTVADIKINNGILKEYDAGAYGHRGPYEFDLNFGVGYNYLEIDSNEAFDHFKDSIIFSDPIHLIGINRGDSVSISDTLFFAMDWCH